MFKHKTLCSNIEFYVWTKNPMFKRRVMFEQIHVFVWTYYSMFEHRVLCLNIKLFMFEHKTLCSNIEFKPHFPHVPTVNFVQTKSYMFEQIHVFVWRYNSIFEHRVLCLNIKVFMFEHKTLCSNIELKIHFRMSSPGLRTNALGSCN